MFNHFFVEWANWLTPMAMLLEMVRRTIWGVFRLENEQLRNTEGYRKVRQSVVVYKYCKY